MHGNPKIVYNIILHQPVLRICNVLVQRAVNSVRQVDSCSPSLANRINICETHAHRKNLGKDAHSRNFLGKTKVGIVDT